MEICVLGAGVVGLTTAWWLAERGFEVTLIDRQPSAGLETSFANGAQLSYQFVTPLASPETLKKLPSLMFSKPAPVRIKLNFDRDFLQWGFEFLSHCTEAAVARTIAAQLALAALSRAELSRITRSQALMYGFSAAGKLILYRSQRSFAAARQQLNLQSAFGAEQSVLSTRECFDLEPVLKIERQDLAGGTFAGSEELGDCGKFCAELETRLRKRKTVKWLMNTQIVSPIIERGRLIAVKTTGGSVEADLFVLSMATGSTAFARAAGFRLPIQPVKGYSITVPMQSEFLALLHSVTDADRKIVFAPVVTNNQLKIRAAGIADLAGNDLAIDEKRIRTVIHLTADMLPVDIDHDMNAWTGLRPATPDGRPIIGPSPIEGLFLNTGHGALGWTLACGSARLSADLIMGELPPVDPAHFALNRR